MMQVASTLVFHHVIIIGIQLHYTKIIRVMTLCPTPLQWRIQDGAFGANTPHPPPPPPPPHFVEEPYFF